MKNINWLIILISPIWISISCNNSYTNKTAETDGIKNIDSTKITNWQDKARTIHDTNVKLSIRIMDSVLRYADSIHYFRGSLSSLLILGQFYQNIGSYDIAIKHYFKALTLAEHKGFKREQAWALNEIGNVFINQNDYDKALTYYKKALQLNEELNNERWIGVNNNNIGLVLLEENKFAEAKQNFIKALSISKKNNNYRSEANSYGNLGLLFEKQNNFDT